MEPLEMRRGKKKQQISVSKGSLASEQFGPELIFGRDSRPRVRLLKTLVHHRCAPQPRDDESDSKVDVFFPAFIKVDAP
jgi:hypothetical protein